jgi:hypothetical protein
VQVDCRASPQARLDTGVLCSWRDRGATVRKHALFGVSIILALTFAVYAQEDSGNRSRSVQGTVSHPDGEPARDAAVQLQNMRTLEIRSYLTHADGRYHFDGLYTNIDYQLRTEYHGAFGPAKTLSRFNSKKVAVVNLKVP